MTAGIWLLVVAGAYGSPDFSTAAVAAGSKTNPPGLMVHMSDLIPVIMGKSAPLILFLLALAAFPPACFSAFIAANSFKTTLPNVNPFISVGIGTVVSIVLAITGLAGKAIIVFEIIGASFGPICGAMMVDYLLAGGKWSGPRAGFNPAGWIAWLAGFVVGILPILNIADPCRASRRLCRRRRRLFRVCQTGAAITGHSSARQTGGAGQSGGNRAEVIHADHRHGGSHLPSVTISGLDQFFRLRNIGHAQLD